MHRYRNLELVLNLPLKVSKDFCKDSALHMTIVSFIGLKSYIDFTSSFQKTR